MRTFSNQDEIVPYARDLLSRQLEHAPSLVSGVSEEILTRPRPDGGWSPAAILEHLAVMNRQYLPKIDHALASSEPSVLRAWKPTLGGRLIRRAVNTTRKVKTPSVFRLDDPSSDTGSVDRFLSSQQELLAMLDRSTGHHWRSVHITSPASNLLRLNLGDVFVILAEHGDRHLLQLEALLRERLARA